jgi:hypothetical protein
MEITDTTSLLEAITRLEQKRREQEQDLSAHFKHTYQSLQPLNLLKNAFQGITDSPGAKGNLIKAGLGLGAGLLSKKLLFGGSGSIFKKLLGTAVELGVAKAVTNKSGNVVAKGLGLVKNMLARRNGID